jgi:hypothetical protein
MRSHKGIVPLVAPEQRASLPWCKDAVCSSIIVVVKNMNTTECKFRTRRHVNKGKQHIFIDIRVLNIYSRIKRAQVFNVPCVGDDPPVLVLDLVRPWSEHLVDDERPLPGWRKLVLVLAALNSSENEVSDVKLGPTHLSLVVVLQCLLVLGAP